MEVYFLAANCFGCMMEIRKKGAVFREKEGHTI